MLRSKIVVAVLAAAMSLTLVPESFARGGFGAHIGGGHFGGGHFGGVRPGFARPGFVGPRAAFFPHRRFFAPGFAFGAGLALGAYPYYYDDPYYYDPGYGFDDVPSAGSPDAVSYCMRRFRTYDPATGTYIGRGGVRRLCP